MGYQFGMACPNDRRGTSARKRLVSVQASLRSDSRQQSDLMLDAARLVRAAGEPDAMQQDSKLARHGERHLSPDQGWKGKEWRSANAINVRSESKPAVPMTPRQVPPLGAKQT